MRGTDVAVTAAQTDDRPRPEHHRRRDDRLVLRAARARLHRDFRRHAQAQPVLRPIDHDRRLPRNRALPQQRRRAARGCGRGGARGGDRRDLCRAALLCADAGRRRHRIDGVELRDLDAARAGRDPGPAAPHLSVPAARNRRAARARAVPGPHRSSRHAGLRARAGGGRPARALPHPLRPRPARHHRQSGRGAPRRHQCAHRRAAGVRRRLGDRRRRRLPGARGRPAGHADVRHVGDIEGPDRHDDRRARIGPGRAGRRIAARASWRPTANGISVRRSAISPPISCCSDFWWCVRAGCSAARPTPRCRRRPDRWTIISSAYCPISASSRSSRCRPTCCC